MTDKTALLFLSNDLRATTLSCYALDIHYQVETSVGMCATGTNTEIRRYNLHSGDFVPFVTWERHSLRPDVFKFVGRTIHVSSFITQNKNSSTGKVEWKFVGDDGNLYAWIYNPRTSELMAFPMNNSEYAVPIAKFLPESSRYGRKYARIELFPGFERTPDTLVLVLVYIEWKRRRFLGGY
ncbi:hypothetical protein SCHPADRAFT_934692 [Schizopora paradoxa]|uniref:DUF6593 domain-containing protein n=1 Tax=Schizopora paradoxa TaxID=27342 RepID=A0A0H2SSJ2_9AGAM|nr:hypothetical protein SCHPADRAFT_934692 [Schizopora paradoxa]